MNQELILLSLTAASVGFVHTVLGPDHYIPFIVMAREGMWRKTKTFWITLLCGIGHVLSSVVIGMTGLLAGHEINRLVKVESQRGTIAGWAILIFGAVYMIWGIYRVIINKPHKHWHFHDNKWHKHEHRHDDGEHSHSHFVNYTPWILFLIFVLGPCEPLIPLLMYPAAKASISGSLWVAFVFGVVTISTMLAIVFLFLRGIESIKIEKLSRYSSALAGMIIFITGIAVVFLGV